MKDKKYSIEIQLPHPQFWPALIDIFVAVWNGLFN
jgi:hypothetical protein